MRYRLFFRSGALLACLFIATSESGAQPRMTAPPNPAQKVLEGIKPADEDEIRKLAIDLKQAVLELNRLRQIPPTDPQAKNLPVLIASQSGRCLPMRLSASDIADLSAAIQLRGAPVLAFCRSV